MASKWNPETDPVHKNEAIGRRLFDEPMLMGAGQQPNYQGLLVNHFEETRGDRELSLDRLGATGPVKAVKQYLIPRAEYAATKFRPQKTFNGWAVISAKFLEQGDAQYKFTVTASPQHGPDLEENIYHAHSKLPEGVNSYTIALHLRHIFTKNGRIESHQKNVAGQSSSKWMQTLANLWVTIKTRVARFFIGQFDQH
jgi:hypothetical protein